MRRVLSILRLEFAFYIDHIQDVFFLRRFNCWLIDETID